MSAHELSPVLVTHPRNRLDTYFGATAMADLRRVAEVRCNTTEDDLSGAARGCAVVIAYRQTPVDAASCAGLAGVRAIVRCAVDIRTIDVAAASAHGTLVTQASAGFMASVSEWIVGAMIGLGRHISAGVLEYRTNGVAQPRMGRELRGAAQANAATENMMNAKAFAAMRKGSYFINSARGELVDDTALLQALDSGHLAGASLDVGRAPDQMPTAALARHPKVIASPHIGGLTPAAIEHQALETVRQTAEILQGRIPVGAVNADAATRLRQGAIAPAAS